MLLQQSGCATHFASLWLGSLESGEVEESSLMHSGRQSIFGSLIFFYSLKKPFKSNSSEGEGSPALQKDPRGSSLKCCTRCLRYSQARWIGNGGSDLYIILVQACQKNGGEI